MTEWIRLPSNERLLDFAHWLNNRHRDHDPDRKCDPTVKRDYKGLLGQRRLAYLVGGNVDMRRLRRGGDGHVDQIVDWRGDAEHGPGDVAVDVKAAMNPTCLMVAKRDMDAIQRPTVFVLAGITNQDAPLLEWDAELLGWEWDHVLRRNPPYDRGGYGIISYCLDDRGRDIHELLAKINRRWGQGS